MDSWHTELTVAQVATRTALLEECSDAASVCEDGVLASGQTSSVVQWNIYTVRPAVFAALVDCKASVRTFDSPVCGAVCRACQVRFSLRSCKKRCADALRA